MPIIRNKNTGQTIEIAEGAIYPTQVYELVSGGNTRDVRTPEKPFIPEIKEPEEPKEEPATVSEPEVEPKPAKQPKKKAKTTKKKATSSKKKAKKTK